MVRTLDRVRVIDIAIGPAGVEHAGEVLTVQRAAYLSEAQRYGDPFLPPLTQPLRQIVEDVRAGRRLVALLGSRVVGSVRAEEHEGVLHIGRLAVAPDLQGHGIGGRLLVAAEVAAGPHVAGYELFTGADSHDNVRLYERFGYRPVRHERLPQGPGLVYLHKRRGSTRAGVPE